MATASRNDRKRILICDDNRGHYERLKNVLVKREGCEVANRVQNAYDAKAALREARDHDTWFDAVLIDLHLRQNTHVSEDGIRVYEELKLDFPNENYMIYTTHDFEHLRGDVARLRHRGVHVVLLDQMLLVQNIGLELSRIIPQGTGKHVFLVHGRDQERAGAITRFLEKGLGLKVIPWDEARRDLKRGRDYIFDIVLNGIEMSDATVVLFTDDEKVQLRAGLSDQETDAGRTQSRANVYIEAGYAFGVRSKKTIFVEWPRNPTGLATPSDFAGVDVLRFRDDEPTRDALRKRLEEIRCRLTPASGWQSDLY